MKQAQNKNTINVTFDSLCFTSPFAVGFTGLPLGLHPHFELVRSGLRYMYTYVWHYRSRRKLISLFLVLCTQRQFTVSFHALLPHLQYHLSICVVYWKNNFPIQKRSNHCQSSHVLQWMAVLQGFRYTTKVIPIYMLYSQLRMKLLGMNKHYYPQFASMSCLKADYKDKLFKGWHFFSPSFPEHLQHWASVTGIYTAKSAGHWWLLDGSKWSICSDCSIKTKQNKSNPPKTPQQTKTYFFCLFFELNACKEIQSYSICRIFTCLIQI